MRVPTTQSERMTTTVFASQRVAAVRVKCLLEMVIDAISKLPKSEVRPYSASLSIINNLFDDNFDKKAYREICNFEYRLKSEKHPCGKKIEDFVQQMVETIHGSNLLD